MPWLRWPPSSQRHEHKGPAVPVSLPINQLMWTDGVYAPVQSVSMAREVALTPRGVHPVLAERDP